MFVLSQKVIVFFGIITNDSTGMSEKRDSNSRHQPWQGCALPTELFSRKYKNASEETRTPIPKALDPKSSVSTNFTTLAIN